MDIKKLKPHRLNMDIYGETEPDDGLIESVREHGILEPIVVMPDGTILSGHRRWRAALNLCLDDIPTKEIAPQTELDEQVILLEFNRQREKTFSQKMRETDKLREIVALRARQKQNAQADAGYLGGRPSAEVSGVLETLGAKSPQGFQERSGKVRNENTRTNSILAEHVGMKRKSYEMAQKVFENAQSGNEKAIELVKKLDSGRTTVAAAYNEVVVSEQKKAAIENISKKAYEPDGLYNVIVVDPPWPYEFRKADPMHKGRCPYPTMSIDEIQSIKIQADDDCVLFLWTTNVFIHDAFHLLNAWGFEYKTVLTWVKDHIGLGNWLRGQTEHCLFSIKGKPPISLSSQSNVIHARIREHSRKPEEFYSLVDSLCHGRKLDMFSREKRDGWDQHGVEAEMF